MKKQLPVLFNIKKTLGPLENDVLNIVWTKNSLTVRDVVKSFPRPLAYTTVMTVMANLYQKGFLKRKEIKKKYHYSPLVKKEILAHSAIRKTLGDILNEYGTRTFLFSFLTFRPAISLPFHGKVPAITGFSSTLFLGLFSFSVWDLMQKMQFFGSVDYLKLILSEPKILQNEAGLIISAFFESLPAINLTISLTLFILTIFAAKKLIKLLNFKMPFFFRLGGLT